MRAILMKEIRDALRSRWLQSYAVLLAVLGLVAAYTASASASGLGLQTFGRTTATLTNFSLLLAPLIAVTMGAAAIAGERDRGTLDYLLAQPLERSEIVLGKFAGLLASCALATVLGFAPAGAIVVSVAGPEALARYLVFPGIAIALIAAMLGLGLLVSVRSRTAVQAQGRAVFLWFAFVLLYDLLLMGTLVSVGLGPRALVTFLVANPVDCARVLVVLALEPDLYLLGPAGAFLLGELNYSGAVFALVASLVTWMTLPLGAALWSFRLKRRPWWVEEAAARMRARFSFGSRGPFDGANNHANNL